MIRKIETSNKKSEPVVNHVTQVKISLIPDSGQIGELASCESSPTPVMVCKAGKKISDHYTRVAEMMEFLEKHGFTFSAEKNSIRCFSNLVEAGEAKQLLIAAGFKDREFQIILEYTRAWGML